MTRTARRKWPRAIAAVLSCLVLTATALAGVGGYFARQFAGNITAGAALDNQPADASPQPGEPINILLMGSDTRTGRNGHGYGHVSDIAGARSDTTILLHISGDRTRALAVSIPRDSKMVLPTCKMKDGTYGGGYSGRFNEAFDVGGPTCTAKAVKQISGIDIDHYVVVDFTGFKNVVNALGGVDVCLKKAVNDPLSKLHLPAGKSTVKGEMALAFVRARHGLADGSDIARIDRQQEFLSSAIRKATSAGTLANPAKLYSVLDAGTKSLTADPGLASFDSLKELALNVSGVKPNEVTFATVPWVANNDGGTVTLLPAESQQLWSAMENDTQWPPAPPAPTNGADGKPLTAAPSTISVNVLNGSGVTGAGTKAAAQLRALGYNVVSVGNAPKPVTTTTVQAGPNSVQAARTLGYATGATIVATKNSSTTLTLTIGPDFTNVMPVVVAKATTPATDKAAPANPRTAAETICAS